MKVKYLKGKRREISFERCKETSEFDDRREIRRIETD